MDKAIQKAIEGGWKPVNWFDPFKAQDVVDQRTTIIFGAKGDKTVVLWDRTVLDPLFWQSLQKALGWPEWIFTDEPIISWKHYWHRFIDHLAEGKDINSFFEELIHD